MAEVVDDYWGLFYEASDSFDRLYGRFSDQPFVFDFGHIAEEFQVGVEILLSALSAPLKQIVLNAGKDNAAVIIEKVLSGPETSGYDANADEVVKDMFAQGIVDPVKVTRMSLQNAASAAAILLTTEVVITDIPEKKEKAGSADGDEMGGMGY